MNAPAAPDLEAMLAWLQSERVVLAEGSVVSWSNPSHPGYRYPEAAALLLSLLVQEDLAPDLRQRIAQRLARDVSSAGGVGKAGRAYVFDTAMALSALMDHARSGGRLADFPHARLFRFLAGHLSDRRACVPETREEPGHWSRSYGCHLLKTSLATAAFLERGDPLRRELCAGLVRDLLPLHDAGRFRTHAGSSLSYLHAHCYAVEGLLGLDGAGPEGGDASLHAVASGAACWLASVQQPEGAIRAWHDGIAAFGEGRADATAQAVRIWALVDREVFAVPIAKALGFLGRLQAPEGGIRYGLESADVNTWATVFTVQAVRWAALEPAAATII